MLDGNLTRDQLAAVNALIVYVAHRRNVSTDDVHGAIECGFGNKLSDIEESNFKAVVTNLVDLGATDKFFNDPPIVFSDDDTLEFGDRHG